MRDESKIPNVEKVSDKIQHSEFRNGLYVPSPIANQIVEYEEEVESSTQSIRIKESLLGVTPSPVAPKVYEISYSQMVDPEEDIRISVIEEKLFFHSMQTFFGDSFLNYVQSLPMIASNNEEEFDFSLSNVVLV